MYFSASSRDLVLQAVNSSGTTIKTTTIKANFLDIQVILPSI